MKTPNKDQGLETTFYGYTVTTFYGYTVYARSMRAAQMILSQARREKLDGDIDAWFYAGCPIGRGYAKWVSTERQVEVGR